MYTDKRVMTARGEGGGAWVEVDKGSKMGTERLCLRCTMQGTDDVSLCCTLETYKVIPINSIRKKKEAINCKFF